jgi:dihydroorotase-like cyclic amidohydrolase
MRIRSYSGGVVENKILLNCIVKLTSTATAKMFGLFPKKGTIAVGSDADIVIFDAEREHTFGVENEHMNAFFLRRLARERQSQNRSVARARRD